MGVCESCLGRGHELNQETADEQDESSRLLFDDPHGHHYGSFADQHTGTTQADPQDVQKETEALQKVVAQTSNYLVDIFAIVPPNGQTAASSIFPAQNAKLLRYQDLLAKMSSDDQSIRAKPLSVENTPNVSDGWLSEEDDLEEMKSYRPVKTDGIGPLLGGFENADSDSDME